MNKLLALLIVAAAIPARAQFEVPKEQMDALKTGLGAFKQRLAPAKVDGKGIETLFDRLAKEPEANFTQASSPDKDGAVEILSISLNEIEGPKDEGKMGDGIGGVEARDLLYRRYFTHMEGVSQKVAPGKGGATTIDEWKFLIGLDGSITAATHSVMAGKLKDAANLEVDKAKSKSYRMSPSDPSVQRRWKELEQKFLKMGRRYEA